MILRYIVVADHLPRLCTDGGPLPLNSDCRLLLTPCQQHLPLLAMEPPPCRAPLVQDASGNTVLFT